MRRRARDGQHPARRPAPRPVDLVLRAVDAVLQLLLPVRRDRLCYTSIPDYTDSCYYVYRRALLTRRDLEHVWLVRDPEVAARIREEFDRSGARVRGHRLVVRDRWSAAGYLAYLTSGAVFHSHGVYAFSTWSLRRHVVCLWHGMPLKAIGRLNRVSPNPGRPFGTLHLASSQVYRYIIACVFGARPETVRIQALPRTDALRDPEARATPVERMRALLGVGEGQRLILWLPTYRTQATPAGAARGTGSAAAPSPGAPAAAGGQVRSFVDDLPPWAMTALDEACREHDAVVIAKLHPFDVLNHRTGALGTDRVRVLTADDWSRLQVQLYDLVAASDGLVSDISSVLVDYLATTRPIGLLGFDEQEYDRELLLPLAPLLESERFHTLATPGEVGRFVAAVRGGQACTAPANDVAHLLADEHAGLGAEAVLGEVGL